MCAYLAMFAVPAVPINSASGKYGIFKSGGCHAMLQLGRARYAVWNLGAIVSWVCPKSGAAAAVNELTLDEFMNKLPDSLYRFVSPNRIESHNRSIQQTSAKTPYKPQLPPSPHTTRPSHLPITSREMLLHSLFLLLTLFLLASATSPPAPLRFAGDDDDPCPGYNIGEQVCINLHQYETCTVHGWVVGTCVAGPNSGDRCLNVQGPNGREIRCL